MMAALTDMQREKLRFHTGDTDSTAREFSDTDLQTAWDESGEDLGKAVIALIDLQIARLLPEFSGGALSINEQTVLPQLRHLRSVKREYFNQYESVTIE